MLALVAASMLVLGSSKESPLEGLAFSFAFEPRIGSYAAIDAKLRTYDFTPVRSPYLTAFATDPSSVQSGAIDP